MRQELPQMVALAEHLLASGLSGTLATLFSAEGSTYRTLGSMMVSFPGVHVGGISGGCLEEFVARQGAATTRFQPAALLRFRTGPDNDDGTPTLGCGGRIDVLVERLRPVHLEMLRALATAYEQDTHALLYCSVSSSGDTVSVSRRWLHGADPNVDPELALVCREATRTQQSRHVSLGPSRSALLHYVPAPTRLLIVGAGDDARPLCDIGRALGWHVTVADRRARLATQARFPTADHVLAGEWDEVVGMVRFSPSTAVVLMTHSLNDDACVLGLLSDRTFAYIGALGPAHRRRWMLDEAAALGAELTESFTQQVRGPIGLNLGDRSPAGIAVSVAADIAACLNGRDARPLHRIAQEQPSSMDPHVCYA